MSRRFLPFLLMSGALGAGIFVSSAPDWSTPFAPGLTAVAQETAEPAPVPGSAPAEAPIQPQQVDETALRYFARSGDTQRLEREIARLRALYPDWTPPQDPLAIADPGDPLLDRMWELYSGGRYAEVREAITARQESEPDWQVPADLVERLSVAEARQRLLNASGLDQSETVVRIAAETPSLLTCSEVDVLWRVSRAFEDTGRPQRALDVYRYILTNCDNPGERLATVQMASQSLDRPAVDDLLSLERQDSGGAGEFAALRLDLARAAIARAGEDTTATVSQDDLQRLAASADETGSASDLTLLGWYNLTHGQAPRAESFFGRAIEVEPSEERTRGLALALLERGEAREAEALLRPYASISPEARQVYVAAAGNLLVAQPPVMLGTDVLGEIVAAIVAEEDGEAAQSLGWYSYGLNQFATAGQWFETALRWTPDEEPAAFGLALVSQRLGETAALEQLRRDWGPRSPRIAQVSAGTETAAATPAPASPPPASTVAPTTAPTATMAPAQTPPAPAPQPSQPAIVPAQAQSAPRPAPTAPRAPAQTRGCRDSVDPRTLSPEAAIARGWCLMEIDRPLEAAPAFEVALLSRSEATRRDAAYGQSLAFIRAGLTDKAAVAAAKTPQTRDRQLELEIALLTDQATNAFEANRPVEALMALDERARLAPEQLDLMVLRGYAYLQLRRYNDAERVFSAAARAGSRDGTRGLNDVRAARGNITSGG